MNHDVAASFACGKYFNSMASQEGAECAKKAAEWLIFAASHLLTGSNCYSHAVTVRQFLNWLQKNGFPPNVSEAMRHLGGAAEGLLHLTGIRNDLLYFRYESLSADKCSSSGEFSVSGALTNGLFRASFYHGKRQHSKRADLIFSIRHLFIFLLQLLAEFYGARNPVKYSGKLKINRAARSRIADPSARGGIVL